MRGNQITVKLQNGQLNNELKLIIKLHKTEGSDHNEQPFSQWHLVFTLTFDAWMISKYQLQLPNDSSLYIDVKLGLAIFTG